AHRDHGLDRQHHARFEDGAAAGLAEVRDLRLFVELLADAMADERPDDGEAVALAVGLHRVRDVAQAVAGATLHDRLVQALASHVEQFLDPWRHRSDRKRDRAVGIIAVDDAPKIEADDVADAQLALRGRDPVNDLLVDRGTDRGREAPVALERRSRAAGRDEGLDVRVDLTSGDAGPHHAPQSVLDIREDTSRGSHMLDFSRGLEDDHGVTASRRALRIAAAT